jgi:hypothetical protein
MREPKFILCADDTHPGDRDYPQRPMHSVPRLSADPKGGIAMMSPHAHVALTRVSDADAARKAAHRPDAIPDPDERVAETRSRTRARRSLLSRLRPARPRHV